ncbi:MAG: efflux RND transporter periplasmic adaptor subunit [Gemmatimonadaceae bacterium]
MSLTQGNETPPPRRPDASKSGRYVVIGFIIVILLLLLSGILPRLSREKRVVAEASEVMAAPMVTVASAKWGDPTNVLALPGTLYGLHETGLYVRTNGYVRSLRADMGQQVRAGDTLAVVEMPELDQELNQARATLAQVVANGELTRSTLERWKKMMAQGAATQQEFDEKQAAFNANQAGQTVARSNVDRLSELKRFGNLIAPFSGVVTARNIDVGTLVSPTVGTGARPLFSLVQVDTMRVITSVPQNAAPNVKIGQQAEILVQELGGVAFKGVVTRTAQSLDLATRTLLTEIQVLNKDRRLLPGMFGQVKLELARTSRALMIPANTLIIRSTGAQVALVRDGKIHIAKITTGRDYGTEVEVMTGLTAGDQLVVNPGDDIAEGVAVRVAAPATKAAP